MNELEYINEDLLQYLWKIGLVTDPSAQLTDGSEISILNRGVHNYDAGPDFLNAKIKGTDGTIWAGNIEIHIKSSDWEAHQHQKDPAYNNVILHVVYHHDKEISDANNRLVPTLEINRYIDTSILDRYLHLKRNHNWIPCQEMIGQVDRITKEMFLDRLMVQRLESKSNAINNLWESTGQDWETLLYVSIAKYLGGKVNAQPFEELARATPLSIIQKNIDQKEIIEAILFGQAGLLKGTIKDAYFQRLKEAYSFYQKKYKLQPIITPWKLARMRPANFPTIRIAQLAAFFYEQSQVFSKIIDSEEVGNLFSLFDVTASSYWDSHYLFGKKIDKNVVKRLGKATQRSLLINVVSPILFKYGEFYNSDVHREKAINLLQNIKAESNTIIKKWKGLGFNPTNSGQTQGLIHLKTKYCDPKACLACSIGHKIMHIS